MKTRILLLFFLSNFLVTTKLEAQTPAPGATNLNVELWLSADKLQTILPADGADADAWMDRSTNAINLQQYSSHRVPFFVYNGLNFHPAVEFSTEAESGSGSIDERRTKLISPNRFTIDSNKSYYTFWVSSVNAEQSSNSATVFNLTSIHNNSNGWSTSSDNPHLWLEGDLSSSTIIHSTPSVNESGIGAAYLSNSTSTRNTLYYNGIPNSSSGNRRMHVGATSSRITIGTRNNDYSNHFYGQVQEIIVLSAPVNSGLDQAEIDKVNSYLAIKYGIGLEANTNYVNSNGTTVWSTTTNTGYNNDIFGIARDDASGLHQKQAKNINNGSFTIFLGDKIEELNLNNTQNLNDNTYFLLGSNGEKEITEYQHPAGTQFSNASTLQDVNFRQNQVYKAQITGAPSFTFNMDSPGRYVLVSNDPNFTPQNTRLYVPEDGITKNVTVNNGEYIGFATYEVAPGGVINGLKVWLKADDISSLSLTGNEIDMWKDQTSNGNNFSFDAVTNYTFKTRPIYLPSDAKMNFYPTVSFDENSYLAKLGGPMSIDNPDDFISFVVYYSTDYTSTRRLYTHGFGATSPNAYTRYPAMGFAPSDGKGRLYASGSGGSINGNKVGYTKYATSLHMIHTRKASAPGGRLLEHDFGGWRDVLENPGTSKFGDNFRMARGAILGGASIATGSGSGSFSGLISEVFFYEKDLPEEDRNKIRTYLGIKYGITLDADLESSDINANYVLSNGSTIVWEGNATPNKGYHNNVAGLVRDDAGDIFNNKAKSSGSGAIITMRDIGHTVEGQGNSPALVNDSSALFWGNNNKDDTISFGGDPDICGDMDERTSRIWMVNKTNLTDQEVSIHIGRSNDGFFPYNTSAHEVFFLVADSAEKLENNNWDSAIPAIFVDGEHQIEYRFTEEFTYFTLGVKELGEQCETADFKGLKTLEFTNSTWTRGDLSRSYDLGDNFNVGIKVDIEDPAKFYRNYPRSSSQKSLKLYRKGKSDAYMTTEITLTKAANATFQIFEIDRRGLRYDDVEVYGVCGENKRVLPKLSYTNKISSYELFNEFAKAIKKPISSYTNDRGKLYVEFDRPVEKIIIKHKSTGRSRLGAKRIGIGPISFTAPQALPPVNEDGLIFIKEATQELLLCEEALITYRIINTTCDSKTVNFEDHLPDGMTWISNSLSIDEDAYAEDSNTYANTKDLVLSDIVIHGGETLVFRAKAMFGASATAGLYNTGRGKIEYERIINDNLTDTELESCDRFAPGCDETKITAIDVPNRPLPVELISYESISSCYSEEETITVTITVNNPNAFAIEETIFDANYNEEFTYVTGSLTSATISDLSNPDIDDGSIYIEELSIPTGQHSISFKIKAPEKEELIEELDDNSNPIIDEEGVIQYIPLEIDFEFETDLTDECMDTVLSGVNGTIELFYCSGINAIISNKMVTPKIKK